MKTTKKNKRRKLSCVEKKQLITAVFLMLQLIAAVIKTVQSYNQEVEQVTNKEEKQCH